MGHKLTAYAVSFATIGVCWFSHRRVFARLLRADGGLDVFNFVVLGLIALLPLSTELLWERGGEAVLVYVGHVALIGLAMGLVWAYAAFFGKLTEPMPVGEALFVLLRVALLPGLMCGLTIFSLVQPWGWALLAGLVGLGWIGRRLSAAPKPPPDAHRLGPVSRQGHRHAAGRHHPPHLRPRPAGGVQHPRARRLGAGAARRAGDRRVRRLGRPGAGGPVGGRLLPVRRDRRRRARRDPREHRRHGLFGVTRVHRRDATDLGPRPASVGAPFDIAFLDPPYAKGLGEKALAELLAGDWLAPGAIVMFERGRDEPDPALDGFERLDARDYGAARVLFRRLT
jgi:uncharacterized membrane protein